MLQAHPRAGRASPAPGGAHVTTAAGVGAELAARLGDGRDRDGNIPKRHPGLDGILSTRLLEPRQALQLLGGAAASEGGPAALGATLAALAEGCVLQQLGRLCSWPLPLLAPPAVRRMEVHQKRLPPPDNAFHSATAALSAAAGAAESLLEVGSMIYPFPVACLDPACEKDGPARSAWHLASSWLELQEEHGGCHCSIRQKHLRLEHLRLATGRPTFRTAARAQAEQRSS